MSEFEPHTRNEALLNAIRENTGGGTGSVDFEPRSRNEYLLNEIRKNTEGGGGGGGSGLPDISQSPDVDFFLYGTNGEWTASAYYANTMWYDYTAAAAQIISGAIQVAAATGSEVAWYIPLDSMEQADVAEFFATLRGITTHSACYISVSNYVAPMAFHMNGDSSEPDKMQIEARFTIPQNGTLFNLHFLLTLTTAYVTCTPVTPTRPPI